MPAVVVERKKKHTVDLVATLILEKLYSRVEIHERLIYIGKLYIQNVVRTMKEINFNPLKYLGV